MPIRYKLLLPLIAISSLAMVLIEELSFINARLALEKRVTSELRLAAHERRKGALEALRTKTALTTAFASDGLINEAVEQIALGEARLRQKRRLTDHLIANKKPLHPAMEVFVLDSAGTTLASTTAEMVEIDSKQLVDLSSEETAIWHSRSESGRTEALHVGTRVLSLDRERAIGFVVNRYDLSDFLRILFSPSEAVEKTELRSYLVDDVGRFLIGEAASSQAGERRLTPDVESLVESADSVLRLEDAEGRRILAVMQRIEFGSLGWLLVVAVDEENAFADVNRLRRVLLVIVGLFLFIVALTSFVIARAITEPIHALARGTQRIRAGNLGHRVGTEDEDEIGGLSRAVDAMAKRLEGMIDEAEAGRRRVAAKARELERSNQELERFAYVASHDLQEPLRKIQAFGDRLRRSTEGALGDRDADSLERILNATARMRKLIDDLLTLSRLHTGQQVFDSVDLAGVVSGVLSDLEVTIEQAGATVECGDLPTIDADRVRMRQLFQNLIVNAIKFRRDSAPPRVEIAADRLRAGVEDLPGVAPGDELYRITVKDNGIGFDQQYADRVFRAFQRLHGPEIPGTGIGLAVCRQIVEAHRGVISLKSQVDQGTEVVVLLPRNQPVGEPVADQDAEAPRHSLATSESEAEKRAEELKKAIQEKQDLIYAVSHDLGAPVRKIVSFGELLQQRAADSLSGKPSEYLQYMVSSAETLSAMIEDLIVLSRVSTEGSTFARTALNEIKERLVSEFYARFEEAGGRLSIGDLPELVCDADQIYDLLERLIENGLRYHKPGEAPKVRVSGEVNGDHCVVTVEDQGIGFDMEHAERIFKPFQTLHPKGTYPGTGMGLAIARRIVDEHGGRISAEAEPDAGARFTVSLPDRLSKEDL